MTPPYVCLFESNAANFSLAGLKESSLDVETEETLVVRLQRPADGCFKICGVLVLFPSLCSLAGVSPRASSLEQNKEVHALCSDCEVFAVGSFVQGGRSRLRFSFGLKKNKKVRIQMDPTRKRAGVAAAESFSQCQIFYCATDVKLYSPAAIIQPQSLPWICHVGGGAVASCVSHM